MLKNGVEYSEEEIDILKEYIYDKKNINTFLETGELSSNITNIKELNDFFYKLEILYGISCKYGISHKLYTNKSNEDGIIKIFVDLKDIFEDTFSNENEKILEVFGNFYKLDIEEYYSKKYDITDAELNLFLEYNKIFNLSALEKKSLKKLKQKIHNYIFSRLKKIQKIYMEEPLIIGNNVTKYCVDKYPGLMNEEPEEEKIITLSDVKNRIRNDIESTIGWGIPNLQEEYYNRRPSYLQSLKYNVIRSKTISTSIVFRILNFGHQTGNYNITKMLAKRGLLVDEVLAFNDFITPKGLENMELLFYNYEGINGKSEPILLEEAINKPFPYQNYNKRNISIKDLQNKGLIILPQDVEEIPLQENKKVVQSNIALIEYKEPWFKKLFRIIKAKFNEEI